MTEATTLAVEGEARSPASTAGWWMLAVLSMLMGFASISTDLYLPAMPQMSRSLNAGAGVIELTVSSYLIGFSVGQLLWGVLSDRIGRRPSVAIGLVMFVIGSAGCALSDHAVTIIIWRIWQAFGACACVAISRAMVRDLYEGTRAAQMLSTLITVMAIAPLIGPSVGGQILWIAGWRAIFWTLVGVGLVTLMAMYTIPETLPHSRRNRDSLHRAMLRYGGLLKSRRLVGYAAIGGFSYAGTFAYVAGTPFAYITYYHVPEQIYGLLFGLGVIGIMATNILNSRLVPRLGCDRMLLIGTTMSAASAIVATLTASTGWGGLWGLVVPLFFFASTTGFVVANSLAGALADFPDRAGAVSALLGAIQYGSGVVGSFLVGAMSDGTPAPMGWVIGITGAGSLACMLLLSSQHESETP